MFAATVLVAAVASPQATRPESPVSATTRRFVPRGAYNWRGAATHALQTYIWYPAAAGTAMFEHDVGAPGAPIFRLGAWADGAPVARGRFPLLLLSHGTGGSAQIMSWLARGLASRGYIVAAVDHPGNNALEPYTPEGFLLWWERARDLTTMLDMLVRDDELAPRIDRSRIGAVGFSLGGYTTIALAGARTDPSRFDAFCRSADAEGYVDPPEFPNLLNLWRELQSRSAAFRASTRQAGKVYRDPRIQSVFAIAPALGPVFIPDSLRRISIPVGIVAGSDDPIAPVRSNAQLLATLIPGAKLTLWSGGVGHYTLLAACTEDGRRAQPQLCADAPTVDRPAIHARAVAAAAEFFSETLK